VLSRINDANGKIQQARPGNRIALQRIGFVRLGGYTISPDLAHKSDVTQRILPAHTPVRLRPEYSQAGLPALLAATTVAA
jgi:hypothetical protein